MLGHTRVHVHAFGSPFLRFGPALIPHRIPPFLAGTPHLLYSLCWQGYNFEANEQIMGEGMFKVIRTGPPRPLNEAQDSGLPTARYELLDVLEFTSKRKRMSVIIRDTSDPGRSRIVLWSKGADSIVYSRLCSSYTNNGGGGGDGGTGEDKADVVDGADGADGAVGADGGDGANRGGGAGRGGEHPHMALARTTLEHLKGFADDGLRTLAVAKREVGEDEYADWKVRFDAALEDPSEIAKKRSSEDNQIDQLMDEMEKELHLVGATALEDKLQVWDKRHR